MDTSQYLEIFLAESREHLQTLNQCLLNLENNPANLSILDEIFRSAHTIKGMSATMGFTVIAELTHEMENILDLLRKADLKVTNEIIDTLFKCIDTLEQLIEHAATGSDSNIDIAGLVGQLHQLAKGGRTAMANSENPQDKAAGGLNLSAAEIMAIKMAQAQSRPAYEVHIQLQEGCLLKSARAYLVIKALDKLGDILKSVPTIEELEQENFDLSFHVVLISDDGPEKIKQTIMNIAEIASVTVRPCPLPEAADCNQSEKNNDHSLKPENDKKDKQAPPQTPNTTNPKIKSTQTVRVDIEKFDTLLNLVGELVINKTRLEQIGQTHRLADLIETIEQMDRVTTDLQAVVMKVRMVPVGQVFNRFPRMVRDLSRELNKEINLIIQGEETELDRTVIDEIGDPLVHLLRNAIDHGIESSAERQEKGKNLVGEIRLIARHEGNNVIIIVEDDGRGINPEIVKQKAVQKGLITQNEADKMDNSEAIRLIFLPGFSTAENVTDISGRGVGMDAVKAKIESLGGIVDVETKINEGSKFKIRLPLTLAIIQALLVQVHNEIYAIPLGLIDSTISIKPEEIKTVQNREVILYRGKVIPIVRLAKVLDVPVTCQQKQADLFVVIVRTNDHLAGIVVDNLIGQQEIVIKSLGKLLSGVKIAAGATILGNGQVALILNVDTLTI